MTSPTLPMQQLPSITGCHPRSNAGSCYCFRDRINANVFLVSTATSCRGTSWIIIETDTMGAVSKATCTVRNTKAAHLSITRSNCTEPSSNGCPGKVEPAVRDHHTKPACSSRTEDKSDSQKSKTDCMHSKHATILLPLLGRHVLKRRTKNGTKTPTTFLSR
jgi:hypothetical protein